MSFCLIWQKRKKTKQDDHFSTIFFFTIWTLVNGKCIVYNSNISYQVESWVSKICDLEIVHLQLWHTWLKNTMRNCASHNPSSTNSAKTHNSVNTELHPKRASKYSTQLLVWYPLVPQNKSWLNTFIEVIKFIAAYYFKPVVFLQINQAQASCPTVSKAYLNIMQPSSANYRYCTNHPLDLLTWGWKYALFTRQDKIQDFITKITWKPILCKSSKVEIWHCY